MNRRSFIGKALAGIAAIPLLGKLVTAKSLDVFNAPVYRQKLKYAEQTFRLGHGPIDRVLHLNISPVALENGIEVGDIVIVNRDRYQVAQIHNYDGMSKLILTPPVSHSSSSTTV